MCVSFSLLLLAFLHLSSSSQLRHVAGFDSSGNSMLSVSFSEFFCAFKVFRAAYFREWL